MTRVPPRRILGSNGHDQGQAAISTRSSRPETELCLGVAQGTTRPRCYRLHTCSGRRPDSTPVLAIGSHADDIEIGCGGTLLALTRARPGLEVTWVVLARSTIEADEARTSAERVPVADAGRTESRRPRVPRRLPPVCRRGAVKDVFEDAERASNLTSSSRIRAHDLHQDHRLVCELTWNTWREPPRSSNTRFRSTTAISELPNVFVPLSEELADEKLRLLHERTRPRRRSIGSTTSSSSDSCASVEWSRRRRAGTRRRSRAASSLSGSDDLSRDRDRGSLGRRARAARGRARLLRPDVGCGGVRRSVG